MDNLFLNKVKEVFNTSGVSVNEYSPLVLAYIGDAVYEVLIRSKLILEGNTQVEKLHKKTIKYVKAEAQKDMILSFLDELTEDELAVFKRARNAKQHTAPKNANLGDYHKATGFEALIGYLYLTDNIDRIFELVDIGLKKKEDALL